MRRITKATVCSVLGIGAVLATAPALFAQGTHNPTRSTDWATAGWETCRAHDEGVCSQ